MTTKERQGLINLHLKNRQNISRPGSYNPAIEEATAFDRLDALGETVECSPELLKWIEKEIAMIVATPPSDAVKIRARERSKAIARGR